MARLRRSDLDSPGLKRRRRGRGFTYAGVDGRPVAAETRERIAALAIPPAWRDVWISPHPNGHIQAVGTDDAGRRQYLYHPDWTKQQDRAKYERVVVLARRLPRVRAQVTRDLQVKGLGRDRVLAGAIRMLDYGVFRTGGEEYAEEYGTHGVATLLRDHVSVRSGEVAFAFTAKGGLDREVTLADRDLARLVTSLRRARTGSDRLLAYHDSEGWHEVQAPQVNEYFKALAGDDFTVKDLRTWQATVRAAVFLAQVPEPSGRTARQRAEKEVMAKVAEELGNTAAVARRAYVDPRVTDQGATGRTIAPALARAGSDDLSRPAVRAALERAVVRLLTI